MVIKVKVNGTELTAKLEKNSSAEAFYKKLYNGSIVIHMNDYGNFEKVGELGFCFPQNDIQYDMKPGDIILYRGSQLVFGYDKNSWSFTKIGEFQNINQLELKKSLGKGKITAEISL